MKVLHIDSSALRERSVSRVLTASVVHKMKAENPDLEVVYRDLDMNPVPHLLSPEIMGEEKVDAALSEDVLRQFLEADVLVLGAPMYNFSIPSTLKAWIDRLAVKGQTFRYTDQGPEGLVPTKVVIVALSYGGDHSGAGTDFVEPYLRLIFGFFGITELTFIRADGVDISAQRREEAINRALGMIRDTEF